MIAGRIQRVEGEQHGTSYDIGPAVDGKRIDALEILKRVLRRGTEITVLLVLIIAEIVQPLLQSRNVLAHIAVFENIFFCGVGKEKIKERLVRHARLGHVMSPLEKLDGVRDGLVIDVAGLVRIHIEELHEPALDIGNAVVNVTDFEYLACEIGDDGRLGGRRFRLGCDLFRRGHGSCSIKSGLVAPFRVIIMKNREHYKSYRERSYQCDQR